MARTLEDFVGQYVIRHGSGALGYVQQHYWLCIGTGAYGDPPPDGTKVGVSLVDPKERVRVLPQAGLPPVYCYLVDGSLNCSGYLPGENGMLPFEIQISLFKITQKGSAYRAPYFIMTVGDPQNAAVWGADDNDPPP